MRVKTLVGVIAALALIGVATPTATATATPLVTKIKLSPSGLKKKAKTTTTLLRLNTQRGVAWAAVPQDPWIHVNPPTGVGDTFIKITLDTNPLVVGDMSPTRESLITFTGATNPTYFPVVQESASTSLSVESRNWTATWEGQSETFPFTSFGTSAGFDCSDAATSNSSNRPWATVTDVTYDPNTTSGAVTVTIEPNDGPDRVATVKVTCGHKSRSIKIKQSAGPNVAVSPATVRPLARGGTTTVKVTSANGAWTAEVGDGADWLTVTPSSSALGTGKVSLTVAPNPGPARVGTIRFSNGVRQTDLTVSQAAGG